MQAGQVEPARQVVACADDPVVDVTDDVDQPREALVGAVQDDFHGDTVAVEHLLEDGEGGVPHAITPDLGRCLGGDGDVDSFLQFLLGGQ